jgi:hypothetical protein
MSERYELIEDAKHRQSRGAFTVLKVGARRHMEELADGHLRFRRLSFYQADENRGQPFYDHNEGLLVVAQASQTQMFVEVQSGERREIPRLAGQVVIRASLDLPVLCLFSIDCGEWADRLVGEEDLPRMLEDMNVPPEMNKNGDTVWVVLDVKAFEMRLAAAVRAQGLGMCARRVTYVDLARVHDHVKQEDQGFVKDARFQNEREFRIRIDPPRRLADPFILDVGSLRDISAVMPLEEFRSSISLAMKAGQHRRARSGE